MRIPWGKYSTFPPFSPASLPPFSSYDGYSLAMIYFPSSATNHITNHHLGTPKNLSWKYPPSKKPSSRISPRRRSIFRNWSATWIRQRAMWVAVIRSLSVRRKDGVPRKRCFGGRWVCVRGLWYGTWCFEEGALGR